MESFELEKQKYINDACATNYTSCEASIFKDNVELRAQLDLLTSKYGKLEESHGKLSSSHEDLLASHDLLKLAHEAIMSKVTSCEPHVDISTTTQNALLPCASPSNSSTHIIAKSCDELLSMPCCSNNEASTSSSTCVVTNHVEEIKELKAQVTSLKKDLVKSHEGKSKLEKMLSVQQSPMTRVDLVISPTTTRSPRSTTRRRAKDKLKIRPRLFASSAILKGTMLDLAPFNIALEANNLGRVFDLFLALLLIVDLGLLLVIGDKTKSTLVIGGLLNTQHFIKFGLPFMTFLPSLSSKK
jgi:hypothetical protein